MSISFKLTVIAVEYRCLVELEQLEKCLARRGKILQFPCRKKIENRSNPLKTLSQLSEQTKRSLFACKIQINYFCNYLKLFY